METNKTIYLCYDLKGIQSFIFAIPKLRHIIGGSALVDRFDREKVRNLKEPGSHLIFSGGGKGAFRCESKESADNLQTSLVRLAHADGMTICFGRNSDYSEAAHNASRMFPYPPEKDELGGHPSPESGLWPVANGKAHPMVQRRIWNRGDKVFRRYEEELLKGLQVDDRTKEAMEFFHDVGSEDSGDRGADALGNRNRWAVIAMDGNDMGEQHRKAIALFKGQDDRYHRWLSEMSIALDRCTWTACRDATQNVVERWMKDQKEYRGPQNASDPTVLPIRPLLIGGDDVVILCHVDYAMGFVRDLCEFFEETSKTLAGEFHGGELWPATGNRLTISAGILFAPVSLPLHSAITFAESLLKSAKGRGRASNTKPSPACLDWESVTEGMVDSPAHRRQREWLFLDTVCKQEVQLTRRPYTLSDWQNLEQLRVRYAKIPGTIRHQVLVGMRQGFWDRKVFVERIRKHQPGLAADLEEGSDPEASQQLPGKWILEHLPGGTVRRSTSVLDVLLLLEEAARMSWETRTLKDRELEAIR